MHITTTARHCDLDDGIRSFAQQRLEKLGRYAADIREIHVVVTAEKYRHTAEITLRMSGHEVVSREQADDARIAVELAADRLERRVLRVKERRAGWRKGGRARAAEGLEAADATDATDATDGVDGAGTLGD